MCTIQVTYNFLCAINSPWQVEILNKMARIYDHDELIEMRYITLGKRQYLPILKCIIRPILNRSITAIDQQLLRLQLTSIHKCIFGIVHRAVTRTHLQPKFCSSLLHLALICLSADIDKGANSLDSILLSVLLAEITQKETGLFRIHTG